VAYSLPKSGIDHYILEKRPKLRHLNNTKPQTAPPEKCRFTVFAPLSSAVSGRGYVSSSSAAHLGMTVTDLYPVSSPRPARDHPPRLLDTALWLVISSYLKPLY
jgi:hypothetical protein